MNKERRQRLEETIDNIEGLVNDLEDISSDEQDAFDNLPESFQCSERGDKMMDVVSTIDENCSTLGDVCESLRGLIE